MSRAVPPGTKVVALDSAKQAHYLPAILGVQAWFGTTAQCIDAACTGRNLMVELQQNDPARYGEALKEADATPNGKGIFWKIEKAGLQPSWLLGSMHVTDPRVLRCVASVHAQSLAYLPNPIAARLGFTFTPTSARLDEVAEHIAEFSVAGIHAVGRSVHAR